MHVQDLKERIKHAILNDISNFLDISDEAPEEIYPQKSSVEAYEENIAARGALDCLADKFHQANPNDKRATLYRIFAEVAFGNIHRYENKMDFKYPNDTERFKRTSIMAGEVAHHLAEALFDDPEIQAKTFTFGPPE